MTPRPALFTPSIAAEIVPRGQTSFPQARSPEDMLALNARQVLLFSLVLLTCVICF
jgi:hypothetical protein